MKLCIGIYLMVLIICKDSYAQKNNNEGDHLICWEEGQKLRWKDFQGDAPPMEVNESIGAVTSSVFSMEIETDAKNVSSFKLAVVFKKNKSWVKDSLYIFQKSLLKHEQLHFDISELHGRKMRQLAVVFLLNKKDLNCPEFNSELGKILKESKIVSQLYDNETKFGNLGVEQDRWAKKISYELKNLDKYKSSAEDCFSNPEIK